MVMFVERAVVFKINVFYRALACIAHGRSCFKLVSKPMFSSVLAHVPVFFPNDKQSVSLLTTIPPLFEVDKPVVGRSQWLQCMPVHSVVFNSYIFTWNGHI